MTNKSIRNASVVVPVYNSERSLPILVERLQPILLGEFERFELIFVNDGSHDRSWYVIEELLERHDWIVGINLMRNSGQHNALLCGIRAARYACIITMDDDLQNPPEEIPRLLAELNEGYDVVYGTPETLPHGFLRNIASNITKLALQGTMGVRVATKVSAFRIFRTELREAFREYRGVYVAIDVLLTWATTRFSAVTVRFDRREFGTSNYSFTKLLAHAINMITGFSILPLQLASLVGFGFVLFGILILVYVVGRFFLEGGSVPGFPFLASIIAIFSGVQLFCIGIIGEYLARMHMRLMNRPTYTIRQVKRAAEDSVPEAFPRPDQDVPEEYSQ